MKQVAKYAYIGLGSNLGDRLANLKYSLDLLFTTPGLQLEDCSCIYETRPVGGPEQGPFLNACISIKTTLLPVELLKTMLAVEENMKRVRAERWGPRIIDLDLLLYEGATVNTPLLQIPHPRLKERDFVLVPLADIDPKLIIPGSKQSVEQIVAGRKEITGIISYCSREWCRSR